MAAKKVQLKDNSGNKAYPVTSSACVGMSDGSGNLDDYVKNIPNISYIIGFEDAFWSNFYNGKLEINTNEKTITIGSDYVVCSRFGTNIQANGETINYEFTGYNQGIIYLRKDRTLHFDTVGAAGTYNSVRENTDRILVVFRVSGDNQTIIFLNHICQSLLIDGVEYSTLGVAQKINNIVVNEIGENTEKAVSQSLFTNYINDAFWSNFYNGKLEIDTKAKTIKIDSNYIVCSRFGTNIHANGETINYTVPIHDNYTQGIIYLKSDGSLHLDGAGGSGSYNENRELTDRLLAVIIFANNGNVTFINHICKSLLIDGVEYSTLGVAENANMAKLNYDYLHDAFWSNFYNGQLIIDTENTTITIGKDYVVCARFGTNIQAKGETINYTVTGYNQGIIYLRKDRSLHFDTVGVAGTYNSVREKTDMVLATIRIGNDNKSIIYVNHICQSLLIDGVEYSTLGVAQNAELALTGLIEKYDYNDYIIGGYFICNPDLANFNKIVTQEGFAFICNPIPLRRGDKFVVSGTSGAANARVYYLTKHDGTLIEAANINVTLNNFEKIVDSDCLLRVSTKTTNNKASLIIYRNEKIGYIKNELDLQTSKQINENGDIISSLASNLCITKQMYIYKNKDIKLSDIYTYGTENTYLSYYDKDGNFISSLKNESSGKIDKYIKYEDIPKNAIYFYANINNSEKYAPEINYVDRSYLYNERQLISNFGAKIAVFGGSFSVISTSRPAKAKWREQLLCDITTYGIGGAGFIYEASASTCIQTQVDNAIASGVKYDVWILWVSTNDFTHGVQPGKPTDYTTHDSYDTSKIQIKTNTSVDNGSTMAGGINSCIKKILEYNKSAKLYIFSPLRFFTETYGYDPYSEEKNNLGFTFVQYSDIIKECANMYNIPLLDQWDIMGINIFNYDQYYRTNLGDSLHMNEKGYERLGYMQAQFLKNGKW